MWYECEWDKSPSKSQFVKDSIIGQRTDIKGYYLNLELF